MTASVSAWKRLTKVQQTALALLYSGESGVITNSGALLIHGQHISPATTLRLVARGLVEGRDGRICISAQGRDLRGSQIPA